MDDLSVNYDQNRYNEIKMKIGYHLKMIGYDPDKISFIPISGWKGDNLTSRSNSMKWYTGPILIDALDALDQPQRSKDKPLRLPLQDVYKIGGIGTVPVGKVETGFLKPGMLITFAPVNITAEFNSIEKHHESLDVACPGDYVGFHVKNVSANNLKRGYVASDSKNDPAKDTASFLAQILVINHPGEIR